MYIDLNWLQSGPISTDAIQGVYNYALTALSYLIAVFASMASAIFTPLLHAMSSTSTILPYTLAFYIAGITGLIITIALMGKKLTHQATHDILTNLPNRKEFQNVLTRDVNLAKRNKRSLAILFIDIDNFKNVNDSLGHQVGDDLLVNATQRLRNSFRKSDFLARVEQETSVLARLGGDEFIFLLTDLKDPLDVGTCAKRIFNEFQKPFILNKQEFHIRLSAGIATYPEAGIDAATLIKNADIAMHRAKELGRNNFQFYTEAMGEAYNHRLTLENGLYYALTNNLFYLTYQPQYELSTKSLRGLEVLLRWNHPTLGIIPPSEFIPIAEKTGIIVPIGEWVLRNACEQYVKWQSESKITKEIKLSVNISPYQLIKGEFPKSLRKILNSTGISPSSLELEITETALMTELEGSEDVLNELKTIGVNLSIDDFGTGYSSLSRIKELPISVLKIDQSFIKNVVKNKNNSAIVKSIIALAKALDLMVIAEGAEEKDQVDFLTANNCPMVQGYYFSKPMTAIEVEKLFSIKPTLHIIKKAS